MAYALGVLGSFVFTSVELQKLVKDLTEVSLILSLPLLLIRSKLQDMMKVAPKMLLSFLIATVTVIISVIVTFFVMKSFVPRDSLAYLVASVSSLFTGGSVNLSSLYLALNIDKNIFVSIMACDFLMGGIYFLISLKISKSHKFCKDYIAPEDSPQFSIFKKAAFKFLGYSLGINLFCVALSFLFFKSINASFLIAGITLCSIVGASRINFKNIETGENWGSYLMILFCFLVGLQTELSKMGESSFGIFMFFALALFFHMLLYFPLIKLIKFPQDQAFIAHIAAIFGPPFVIIIGKNMRKENLIAPGIAVATLGIGGGTFIGLGMFKLISENFL